MAIFKSRSNCKHQCTLSKGTFNLGTTYILITDKDAYMLDNEGGILSVDLKTNVSKNLGPSVYFSDIPFPKSLSNIVLT